MCVHIHHLKLHTRRYLEIQERIDQLYYQECQGWNCRYTAFHDTSFRCTLFFFSLSLSLSNELPASVRLRIYLETDNGSLRLETDMLCIWIITARWNNGGYKGLISQDALPVLSHLERRTESLMASDKVPILH